MEHLKHIFNVPGSVAKTQDLIQEGRFLLAHKALSDLEGSRDDLLYELHKQANNLPSDKAMLKQYFADVERLSDELGKQLWVILKRTLNTVRKEPQVRVSFKELEQFAVSWWRIFFTLLRRDTATTLRRLGRGR